MLQRAANHAYSWWWASHIRTKQSKWLEQSLQDMEEKVQGMLLLIEGDGDSFAKRAEMYYRRRPELISSVEESYKVFRALADRYDLLSKDLQNANHTIATVFPEQVQFSMADDDDIPKIPDNFQVPEINLAKIPQVPKAPTKDLKTIISKASKQVQVKKLRAVSRQKTIVKSGLSKEEALEEVSKLQKEILSLQTMKEFVKSSYESGIAKYWGIESQVMEMQTKISRLQDEFNMDTVIEDEEARTLMAEAALKSCQETLAMLEEKQEKTRREAIDEYKRIELACERLQSIREKYLIEQSSLGEGDENHKFSKDVADLIREAKEIEELPEKSEESLDMSSLASLSVSQLAEKIDLLVNKVFTLETAVSSQTVLVNTLRSETDDLNSQIRNLEDEHEVIGDDTLVLSTRVRSMEEKLNKVQDLTKNVEVRNNSLETNFARTRTSLDHLAGKLTSVKEEDEVDDHEAHVTGGDGLQEEEVKGEGEVESEKLSVEKDGEVVEGANLDFALQSEDVDEEVENKESQESLSSVKGDEEGEGGESVDHASKDDSEETIKDQEQEQEQEEDGKKRSESSKTKEGDDLEEDSDEANQTKAKSKGKAQGKEEEDDDDISWQQILLSGMEDREKILLKEYTTILRNYKEVKKKLNDVEKKERDSHFDTTIQMRELKKAISKRDEEIMILRRRLSTKDGNNEDISQLPPLPEESDLQPETGEDLDLTRDIKGPPIIDEHDENRVIFVSKSPSMSRLEEKLRTSIDAILDENLDFWFRFSTAFHQIQKFKTEVRDLEDEVTKLREKRKPDGSYTTQIKSEVMPIYKHLTEIQRELTIWLDRSVPLKEELKNRCTSLNSIQEEITKSLKEGVEADEIKFSSHQAAKLQGEVLNMKQENDKVREELEAGLEHVSRLQLQIEKRLAKLNGEFGISAEQSENRHKVPLRSFIFGGGNSKSKKPKNSLFSCMHPSRKYQILRAGIRLSSPSPSHSHNNSAS